jgi:hypothetical protein
LYYEGYIAGEKLTLAAKAALICGVLALCIVRAYWWPGVAVAADTYDAAPECSSRLALRIAMLRVLAVSQI